MKNHLLTALIALVFGFAGAALWSLTGLDHAQTRDYLVANPEILPEMAEAFETRQAEARLEPIKENVKSAYPGAVLGNPDGSRTLVKFTDYGCTFCRQSTQDIDRLIAEDPELRVVVREWPIFEGSEWPARMALAAAAQGKYAAFYHAMFEQGATDRQAVETAARRAGLDMEAAQQVAKSDAVSAELARNLEYARTLGFTGTPSWVAQDQILQGAVGFDRLAQALDTEN